MSCARGFSAFANGRRAEPKSITAANARIHDALRQPIPMHFPDETPLEDVLKSIKQATASADSNGKAIPIYVDPIGMQEAEKSMTSVVSNLDFDGVPLESSLRSCLKQLDLTYSVKDGLLLITSRESHDNSLLASAADAYQVVGHCVLALIAAGLGGLAAPYVCKLGSEAGEMNRRVGKRSGIARERGFSPRAVGYCQRDDIRERKEPAQPALISLGEGLPLASSAQRAGTPRIRWRRTQIETREAPGGRRA